MKEFKLLVVTPDGLIFDGMAESVLVRAASGDIEIMAGHEDFFASLVIGRAKLVADGTTREAAASGGFVSVLGGEVKLSLTTFEFAEEIDTARAKIAKEKAEEQIKRATDKKELDIAKARLLRALNRLSVAKSK